MSGVLCYDHKKRREEELDRKEIELRKEWALNSRLQRRYFVQVRDQNLPI